VKIHARSSVQETRADCPSPILACFKYGMQVRRATFQWECGAGIPLPAGPCHCGLAARILSLFFFSFLVTHLIPSSFPSSASTASASHSWVGCIVVGQSAGCVPSQRRGPAKQTRRAERGSGLETPVPAERSNRTKSTCRDWRALSTGCGNCKCTSAAGKGRLPAVGRGNGRTGTTHLNQTSVRLGAWIAFSELLGGWCFSVGCAWRTGMAKELSKTAVLKKRALCCGM